MKQKFQTISLQAQDGVTTLTLNRPEIHNAFDEVMIDELAEAFTDLSRDRGTRVVVLTGAGKSFCSGADLNWMKKTSSYSRKENIADAERFHQMLLAVDTCSKPVIARVNGSALGGGAGLVAATDMAYAVQEAKFGFPEIRLGLVPAVISPFVIRKIGEAKAREYFLTGEIFSSRQAQEMGLIQETGAVEEIEAIITKKIQALRSAGPEGIKACKELIRHVAGKSPEEAGKKTAQWIAELRAGEEGKEGIEAFLNKRKPKWVSES
jgi:methylglutaconyl-CoA hydratase